MEINYGYYLFDCICYFSGICRMITSKLFSSGGFLESSFITVVVLNGWLMLLFYLFDLIFFYYALSRSKYKERKRKGSTLITIFLRSAFWHFIRWFYQNDSDSKQQKSNFGHCSYIVYVLTNRTAGFPILTWNLNEYESRTHFGLKFDVAEMRTCCTMKTKILVPRPIFPQSTAPPQTFSMPVTVQSSNQSPLQFSNTGNTLVTTPDVTSSSLTDGHLLSPQQPALQRNTVSPGLPQRPASAGEGVMLSWLINASGLKWRMKKYLKSSYCCSPFKFRPFSQFLFFIDPQWILYVIPYCYM